MTLNYCPPRSIGLRLVVSRFVSRYSIWRILRRCRGTTTVLIGGGGLVMARLVDQQLDLQAALKEAN